jgi:hypothetical protein
VETGLSNRKVFSMRLIPVLIAFILALAAPAEAVPVGIDAVRDMAFDKGIVNLKEVELDDGVWEVEGYDADGHEIEMEVDARSGAILMLKRD